MPATYSSVAASFSSGSCFVAHANPGCDKGGCCSVVCAFNPACCNVAWDSNCASSAMANCLEGGAPPALQLSEMRLRDPDNVVNNIDQSEYLEFTGTPGASLNGVSIVILNNYGVNGSSQPNLGKVRAAVSLNGLSIGASGRFLVTEQTFAISGVTSNYNCGGGLVFDNSGAQTVYLAWNFYGAIGDDLDTDDDGILDTTPWMSSLDDVTVIGDSGAAYSVNSVGPSSGVLPAQVYRCLETGVWTIGPSSVIAGYDTPGAANASCSLPRMYSCGDSDAGDCYQPHGNAHCFNRACCEAVCAVVPECCSVIWDETCVTATAALTACGGGNSPVVISELRVDQDQNSLNPSTSEDQDEYVELRGQPGTTLDAYTLIVLGDATVTVGGVSTNLKSGAVECVVPLTGGVIPPSGHFLITVKNTASGAAARDGTVFDNYPASTGLVGVAGDLQTAALNLENDDNVTFMLVEGFTGAVNNDLDTNDDGVLDTTPWTSVLDSVSLVTSIRATQPVGSTSVRRVPGISARYLFSLRSMALCEPEDWEFPSESPVFGTTPGSRCGVAPFVSLVELTSLSGATTPSLNSVVVLVRSVVTTCAFTAMRTPEIHESTVAMRPCTASSNSIVAASTSMRHARADLPAAIPLRQVPGYTGPSMPCTAESAISRRLHAQG